MFPKTILIVAAALLSLGYLSWMGEGKWVVRAEDPIPTIPVRQGSRMCCAFGKNLSAKFAGIPVPFVRVSRVANPEGLGPHRYDAPFGALDDERGNAFPFGERNALIYTCRGGFIDTAHLREPADWVSYFIAEFDRHLEGGAALELPEEGASRRVILRAVPSKLIERNGRDEVIIAMAQWTAFQLSIWHEVIQWYGVSLLSAFPETASGFSPEDTYSNAVGLRLMDGIDFRTHLASEKAYNRFLDDLLIEGLMALDPVPKELGNEIVDALDQVWWDSQLRLPERSVVLRRYLDIGTDLLPWLLPDQYATASLRANLEKECGANPKPQRVQILEALDGFAFRDYLTLEFAMDGALAETPAFPALGARLTQDDFPKIMEAVREENRRMYGPRADRPD